MPVDQTMPSSHVDEDDFPHRTAVRPDEDARTILINEVNWGAVFAGVALALVVHLIISMLGLALGVAAVDPQAGDNPTLTEFSIGAGMWWAISGIVAAFAGGVAAGRLSGTPKESTAGWHGVISWAFTTLFIFYIVTAAVGGVTTTAVQTVSGAASGLMQATGGAISTATQAVAPSGSADPFASIERAVRSASGSEDPAAMRDAAVSAMRAVMSGSESDKEAARTRAAEALAKARNIPVDQARQEVQRYEAQYRQAVENVTRQAAETADAARSAVTSASIFATIALLLGALAAWLGGRAGVVSPTVTIERLRAVRRVWRNQGGSMRGSDS